MYDERIKLPVRAHDLTGQRRGTWTVVGLDESTRLRSVRWLARCDCGREKAIAASNWRSGKCTQTCHCTPRPENYNQLPPGEASFNFLLAEYRRKSVQRGIEFALTRDDFRKLTRESCFYCGAAPANVKKTSSGDPYIYNGVDRVDNSRGYMDSNVVPCCRYCNQSKSDLTLDQWRDHIRVLYRRLCS